MKYRLILFLLVASIAGCTNSEVEKKEIIRKVKVAAVQTDEPILKSEFSGIIRENSENNLAFRVAGPIQGIFVKVTTVQAGLEFVIFPFQGRALFGLVIRHIHSMGAPVFAKVLFVIADLERF